MSDENIDEECESARLAANEPNEKFLINLYKKPIISYAVLPGGYYYLNVTKPGLFLPYDEEKIEVKKPFIWLNHVYLDLNFDSIFLKGTRIDHKH